MFRDLEEFYNGTKSEKIITICLTATPFEGDSDGLQCSAINELGYKVYNNSSKKEDFDPVIHREISIGSLDGYRTLILQESEKCGVLIYANDKEYESLKEEPNVKLVTLETSYLTLETMDAKHGPRYPVFMIDKNFGGRGYNFRAKDNPNGITMFILGSFPDRRTEVQTLMRVGRFGDQCTRIRDTKFERIDNNENAKRKGETKKLLDRVRAQRAKAANKGRTETPSLMKFQDKHLTNLQFNAKQQVEMLT